VEHYKAHDCEVGPVAQRQADAWGRAVCDERGERPVVVTVEECGAEVVLYRERFWYGYWRLRGACLLNRVEPSIPGFGWGCKTSH